MILEIQELFSLLTIQMILYKQEIRLKGEEGRGGGCTKFTTMRESLFLIVRFLFLIFLFVNPCEGEMFTEEQNELVESAAEMLYGLIHSRYILTSKGLSAMVSFFKFLYVCVYKLPNQYSLLKAIFTK